MTHNPTIQPISPSFTPLKALIGTQALALALVVATPAFAQTDKDTVRWDDRGGPRAP
jgi:hypothetical protein